MVLSENTIAVLKNFSKINPSIIVKPGSELKTLSPNKAVLAVASNLDDFSSRFAIYSLDRLISTLSLFDKPEISFSDNSLLISKDNKKVTYGFASEDVIKAKPPEMELSLPSVDCSFSLTEKEYNDLIKACSVLGANRIVIRGDGDFLYLESSHEMDTNLYSLQLGETDKNFKAVLKTDNIKMIPADYEVSLSSKGMVQFKAKSLSFPLVYFVAVEKKESTF